MSQGQEGNNQDMEADAFFKDPRHLPSAYSISHWSADPYSNGAWSQLSVGGTPEDRRALGQKISNRLILAGEACHVKYPAMVHGAALSGIHAVEELLFCDADTNIFFNDEKVEEEGENVLPVVVIGAGAAGLFAATTVQTADIPGGFAEGKERRRRHVVVLEAKERHGGRVHTVTLPPVTVGTNSTAQILQPLLNETSVNKPVSKEVDVQVDLGASWLQQFPDNFLATRAGQMLLDLHPTDFQDALCASSDGVPMKDLHGVVEKLCDVAEQKVAATVSQSSDSSTCSVSDVGCASCTTELSLLDALQAHIKALPSSQQREAHLALAGDINSDFGYFLHDTSIHALLELGVGNEDHYIKQGYGAILDPVARELDIRYECPVQHIDWAAERKGHIAITTKTGEIILASHCICTVPVSLLQGPAPAVSFSPPLPAPHLRALRHIHQGKCEKVVLRYSSRWWPSSPNGFYRWYDNHNNSAFGVCDNDNTERGMSSSSSCESGEKSDSPLLLLDWNEWLDMTDCLGAPVVMGFCVGEEACARFHSRDRSDADIAAAAARAFEAWAWHRSCLTQHDA